MTTLPWTDALHLGPPEIDHTEAHFGREDRWIQQTGFASSCIHMGQHHAVLQAMRGAQALGERGQWSELRAMVRVMAMAPSVA